MTLLSDNFLGTTLEIEINVLIMKHTQTCHSVTQKISSPCDFCTRQNFNLCKICAFSFLRIRVKLWRCVTKIQQKLQKSWKIQQIQFLAHAWNSPKMSNFCGYFGPCKKFNGFFRWMTNFCWLIWYMYLMFTALNSADIPAWFNGRRSWCGKFQGQK